jgi:hypothetical protein
MTIEQTSRDDRFRLELAARLIAPRVDDFFEMRPPIGDVNADRMSRTSSGLQALRRRRAEQLDLPQQPLGALGELLDSAACLIEMQGEALELVQIDSRR